jgi:SAM-dependent methyltransferase
VSEAQSAHRDAGLHRLLNRAGVYDALQALLLRSGSRTRYVREYVRPFPGCRVLDIGCGPGTMLAHLPASIGSYTGYDMNPAYIEAARSRWGNRGTFHCRRVEPGMLPAGDAFDIVLANGIVHHLDDAEAGALFEVAWGALPAGGWLVTYDNVYLENQNWLARWLIARDRGRAVRTREGYESLARERFGRVESAILHDTLRVPYTILVMRCIKGAEP